LIQWLAYAIGHMKGVRGYSAWRWIFILEGTGTCVLAAAAFFIIPDWPEDAKFLKLDERTLLIRRLSQDCGETRMDSLDKRLPSEPFQIQKYISGNSH
jgi:hypothetical protein